MLFQEDTVRHTLLKNWSWWTLSLNQYKNVTITNYFIKYNRWFYKFFLLEAWNLAWNHQYLARQQADRRQRLWCLFWKMGTTILRHKSTTYKCVFFQILWKSRYHQSIISCVTFPSHLKKLRYILRFWLEKLNCGLLFLNTLAF